MDYVFDMFGSFADHISHNIAMRSNKSFLKLVEALSHHLYFLSTSHRFNKNSPPDKKAYDEGFIISIDWMEDLCFHYFEEDRRLRKELETVLEENLKKIHGLKKNPKTQGMIDAIEKALDYVKSPPSGRERG